MTGIKKRNDGKIKTNGKGFSVDLTHETLEQQERVLGIVIDKLYEEVGYQVQYTRAQVGGVLKKEYTLTNGTATKTLSPLVEEAKEEIHNEILEGLDKRGILKYNRVGLDYLGSKVQVLIQVGSKEYTITGNTSYEVSSLSPKGNTTEQDVYNWLSKKYKDTDKSGTNQVQLRIGINGNERGVLRAKTKSSYGVVNKVKVMNNLEEGVSAVNKATSELGLQLEGGIKEINTTTISVKSVSGVELVITLGVNKVLRQVALLLTNETDKKEG